MTGRAVKENHQILSRGQVLDLVVVQADAPLPRPIGTMAHLPQAGHSMPDIEPAVKVILKTRTAGIPPWERSPLPHQRQPDQHWQAVRVPVTCGQPPVLATLRNAQQQETTQPGRMIHSAGLSLCLGGYS